jgi:SAM-dependent methyltransferase
MAKKVRSFTRCEHGPALWTALSRWYDSRLGQMVAECEQGLLHDVLSNLFGFHLLMVGHGKFRDYLSNSRISHRMIMEVGERQSDSPEQFLAQPDAVPVQTDSIDVIVLPHLLEFSERPHDVLREVDRVLIPEGHVVILGFNPFSLWNLWRWALGWKGRVPWCGRFISATRMKDWLALLGFEVIETHYYFFRPPLQQKGLLGKLRFLERLGRRYWPILGGAYVMVARKHVITLTPIRPRWETKRKLVNPGLVEPMSPPRRSKPEP